MNPAPLTPADLDLRDFPYMPLDVVRLRDSDLMALTTAEGFRAAVGLWCAAWHQVPAASLPSDDRVLCHLAGFGRDMASWQAVRDEALRGFVLCSDGRFYHTVIAEKAIEAKQAKERQRNRTQAATDARRGNKPTVERDDQRDGARDDVRNVHQGKGREEKGEDRESSDDEKIIHLNSSSPTAARREARKARYPFPSDKSIHFGVFGDICKEEAPGVDRDVIAAAFRSWARRERIPFDREDIERVFRTFAKQHRVSGRRA